MHYRLYYILHDKIYRFIQSLYQFLVDKDWNKNFKN